MSLAVMAELGGLVYVAFAASSFATGLVTDRWIRAGASVNRVRRTAIIASHVILAGCLVVAANGNISVSVTSLLVAGVAFGFSVPNLYAIGQTVAGPRAAAKWMGVQNCIGNMSGIVAPIITGIVVDRSSQYYWAFIISAAVVASGIFGWAVLIRTVAPLDWGTVTEAGEVMPAAVG